MGGVKQSFESVFLDSVSHEFELVFLMNCLYQFSNNA